MKNDSYDRQSPERARKYAEAFTSPEAKVWVNSLTDDQRQIAEAHGLLEPLCDRASKINSLHEELTPCHELIPHEPEQMLLQASMNPRHQRALRIFLADIKRDGLNWSVFCYLAGEGTCEHYAHRHGLTRQAFHYHAQKLQQRIFDKFSIVLTPKNEEF